MVVMEDTVAMGTMDTEDMEVTMIMDMETMVSIRLMIKCMKKFIQYLCHLHD